MDTLYYFYVTHIADVYEQVKIHLFSFIPVKWLPNQLAVLITKYHNTIMTELSSSLKPLYVRRTDTKYTDYKTTHNSWIFNIMNHKTKSLSNLKCILIIWLLQFYVNLNVSGIRNPYKTSVKITVYYLETIRVIKVGSNVMSLDYMNIF